MAGDAGSEGFTLNGDTLKNWGVIVGIVTTLFGVINFGASKISLYDGYAPRLAKLEARDQAVITLSENDRTMTFYLETQKADISGLKARVENLATDVIQLRLNTERLRVLLEQHK